MTLAKACQPPSLVYTMQGPLPMEIDQAPELIVMRLEYYDLVRVIYLDGRGHPRADAPHTKMGPLDRPVGGRHAGRGHHPL
jgi:hypothetical protein